MAFSGKYKLDDQAFTSLKKDVHPHILKKLKQLKGKEYQTEEEFVKALEAIIGKPLTETYKPSLLKYAAVGQPQPQQPQPLQPQPQPPQPQPPQPPVQGALVINDSLMNSRTEANAILKGGGFTPQGYQITASYDGYILYETNIKKNIRIEFDVQGYIDLEPMIGDNDNFLVMIMHDAQDPLADWRSSSVWRDSPNFLFQVRKLGGGPGAPTPNSIQLKAGCEFKHVDGSWTSYRGQALVPDPLEWNPNVRYHWVIQVKNGHTDIIRNDAPIFSIDTGSIFDPDNRIVVSIGGMPHGPFLPAKNATYSNVKIYQL